jgi:hypothetical protein
MKCECVCAVLRWNCGSGYRLRIIRFVKGLEVASISPRCGITTQQHPTQDVWRHILDANASLMNMVIHHHMKL